MKKGISITGGKRKGGKIKVPKGIRPTQGIVKRSLFDSLGTWIQDKTVLEIFAGSGAIGFEALSRGASSCTFVEKSRAGFMVIKDNAEFLGFEDKVKVLRGDYLRVLNDLIKKEEKFHFIFADPPYTLTVFDPLFKRVEQLLDENGLFVIEVRKHTILPNKFLNLKKEKEVSFGQSKLAYYSCISG